MGQASTADREGFWRECVAGWKRSGVSLRIDSERHGLKAGTLGVWSSKLKDRTAAPDETAVQQEQAADMPFVLVGVVETAEATPTVTAEWMELVLPSGHLVRVGTGFDVMALKRLLDLVESRR